MPLVPGHHLGPYKILAALGAGGMGEVYRACDTRLDREIALKVLPAEVAAEPDRLARFEREAKSVAALNHPNIVVLHSIEEAAGVRFLTMELVDGEPLDRLVVAGGQPLTRVLDVAIAIADALAAAHAKGIVHRDLKPANVVVTRDGRVKVLDFGLAKLANAPAADAARTVTAGAPISSLGQVVGTVPYMSPEQLRGEPVDARSDLFSLGILVYELASGRRPFGGTTTADVTSAILRDPPPPLSSLRADLPPDVAKTIERCLEKDVERRARTAKDVRAELEHARRALGSAAAGKPSASPASDAREAPSVAVLPFVNMSRDEENEYFSDGLSEELLNVLAKVRGLRVAARSSAFSFKGKGATVAEVGKALNVAAVLEGSVRKAGNRVRIGVQLVKVEDGYSLWSETYDRTLDDIFAVQDDIAQAVVKELRTTLLGGLPDSDASREARAAVAEAAKGRGRSGEAHELYMQGRFLIDRFGHEDVVNGIGHLRRAVALDPTHALAWASLGRALASAASYGWLPVDDGYPKAREATLRALEIEPDLAEGYTALSAIQLSWDWDWAGAMASARRSVELAPGNAEVLRQAASVFRLFGSLDESIAVAQRAIERDPLSPSAFMALGTSYRIARRDEETVREYRRALELAPNRAIVRHVLSFVLLRLGRLDEARREAEAEPEHWARLTALAILDWTQERRDESDRSLRAMIEHYAESSAFQIAGIYTWRGQFDEAFEWLERARAQRDPGVALLAREPWFDALHSDRRWAPFLQSLGMTPEGAAPAR
jgi:serine/threonine protein kinase/tetratricopeptide (TPR) repeat protein